MAKRKPKTWEPLPEPKEVTRFREACEAWLKEVTVSREAADAAFRRMGIHDAKGRLTKPYR